MRRLPQSALLLDGERIVESNPGAEFVLGRGRSDLVDRPWNGLLAKRQADDTDSRVALEKALVASLKGGDSSPRPWRLRRADGSPLELAISLTAVEDGPGLLALALIQDPSEWRQSAPPGSEDVGWEQLGKLSRGIAHEFNNMLTAIDGGLDNATAAGASRAEVQQGLAVSRSCVRRAARLNRRLLNLSRDRRLAPRAIRIDSLLQETLKTLAPILGSGVEIDFQPGAAGLSLAGDPEQLEQAIFNLALNARDAMPGGGKLHVSTAGEVVDAAFVERHPWARPGRYIRVEVRDAGEGIPYDLLPRVFEPFFTSRAAGRGVGLGLSIVYAIVKQHRGFIDLDSRPGAGTRVWMLFPQRLSAVVELAVGEEGPTSGAKGVAVLVVDDEEVVRELAVTALRRRGYRVLHAASAEEAETTFNENFDSVGILVADLMLTGLGGFELSQRFKARKPGLQVLYTSGYDIGQLPGGETPGEGAEFLQKPYTLRNLADRVGRMLHKE